LCATRRDIDHFRARTSWASCVECVKRKEYDAWEAEVMKDEPGFDKSPNVYKTRTFMPPFMSTSGYER
jgi:hypothetical protein